MTEQDDTRSIAEDGTQEDSDLLGGGGRSSYGPPISVGGEQQPGGVVPPYDGRQESAEMHQGGTHRDGANVGGATGPRVTEEGKTHPDPEDTPGGREWSPSDEMPSTDPENRGEGEEDPGVGPGHMPGTGKAERNP